MPGKQQQNSAITPGQTMLNLSRWQQLQWFERLWAEVILSSESRLHPCTWSASHIPPEAAQPEGLGKLPSAVILSIHHRGDGLSVLHDDGDLAVPLAQHAAVIDVGRA